MARISFTPNLMRHIQCPPTEAQGKTVRELLEALFTQQPQVRAYVLDDQGALRKHMAIFVDGEQVRDRAGLGDAVADDAEVYVMQALSGGL